MMKQRSTKRNKTKWFLSILFTVFFLLFATKLVIDIRLPAFQQTASIDHGWNLILVNQNNPLPQNFNIELTVLSNGQSVDERIYPALQEMFDDMRAEGKYPIVVSGYRTQAQQQELMDGKVQAYIDEGYSKSEAKELAKKWVAVPGTSEHQLGLAVDINQDVSRSTADEIYDWLAQHAYKYGFIQRYPQDKTDITGTYYEPWHYRYVGIDVATQIVEKGICLEEYIDLLNR